MPAVNYDYDYTRATTVQHKKRQGVAKNARSVSASNTMSAQKKVSSNHATQNKSKQIENKKVKKYNHEDIDIPVTVKKKIEVAKPQEMKLTKPKDYSKSKKKVENAKKSIFGILLGFGALFIICTRYAQINELTHKLNGLEKDLVTAEALNQQLNSEIDSKTDLSYVERYAKYQLGMQKPDEKQIVRIAYDKQDKISTPIIISEESEPSFWDKLWKDLRNLVD